MKSYWVVGGLAMLIWLINGWAEAADSTVAEAPTDSVKFVQRAEMVFTAAKTRFETEVTNSEAALQFGRACYDWADYSTTDKQRAYIAEQGIAACRKVIEQNSNSAPGHYYLAMDLGQLAQTKSLGALKIVGQMEAEFKTALQLDPTFDFAGADRGLGLLYLEAPGWPASIGNKSRARQHLQTALKLYPNYPENVLNLIEAELKWNDKHDALRELTALNELWPTARKRFTGDEWAASWAGWEKRRELVEKKLAITRKSPPSPQEQGQN